MSKFNIINAERKVDQITSLHNTRGNDLVQLLTIYATEYTECNGISSSVMERMADYNAQVIVLKDVLADIATLAAEGRTYEEVLSIIACELLMTVNVNRTGDHDQRVEKIKVTLAQRILKHGSIVL